MASAFSTQLLRSAVFKRNRVPGLKGYPFSIPTAHNLTQLEFYPEVMYLMGGNDNGKAASLEALAGACGFNSAGRSVSFPFSTRNVLVDRRSLLHRQIEAQLPNMTMEYD